MVKLQEIMACKSTLPSQFKSHKLVLSLLKIMNNNHCVWERNLDLHSRLQTL